MQGLRPDPVSTTYGLFESGDACVGVPLSDVREVTPCPDQFDVLPVTAPGLLGAVNLRGQVIPVLDLLAMHGHARTGQAVPAPADPPERRPRRVIVVLLRDHKLLGLIVDSVHGVIVPATMTRVGTPDGGGLLVSHTFTRPETGNIVSVLDVDAMFALPGVPMVQEEGRSDGLFGGGDEGGAALHSGGAQNSMLLVRCADHRLAISIKSVHTILPRVQVRSSPLRHGSCKGVTDYDGVEIPVFDPLELAGLGSLNNEESEGVAIRFNDGLVVMLLSGVLELINTGSVETLNMPAMQVPGRRYLGNVLRVPDHGDFLTLEVGAMLENDELQALSRLNTPHQGTVPAQRAGRAGADDDTWTQEQTGNETYLTFSAGREMAVPLRQVVEILEFPSQYSVLEAGHDQVLGLFTHRDTVVPLYRLTRLLQVPDSPLESSYVLIVSTDADGGSGQVVGLVVHALRAIEKSVWEDPEPKRSGYPEGSLESALADMTMLRLSPIGTADEPRMLPRVDLTAIGAALVPNPTPQASSVPTSLSELELTPS
nr:chemotaxis protein CheW [Kineosporia mesophila]